MANPSNLYAEKIFSEHPISLWSLDETVDYMSLITEQERDLSEWTVYVGDEKQESNTYSEPSTSIIGKPFQDSVANMITAPTPLQKSQNIKFVSNHIIGFNELDSYMLPHPILGKISLGELAIFTSFHTSHHFGLLKSKLGR